VVAVILVLTVAVLLDGSSRTWLRTYDSVHAAVHEKAEVILSTFGTIGRRANRASYTLYTTTLGLFLPALPDVLHPDAVVSGNAVEFRYWDVPLDATDSHNLVDTSKLATAYALFYLDGHQLKVDYGPYPPGAVLLGAGVRNTTGVTTVVLADHVNVNGTDVPFTHNTVAGVGQGSVRLNVTLTDPNTGDTVKVMTTAFLRNAWPR
jgi:hypothetical protein